MSDVRHDAPVGRHVSHKRRRIAAAEAKAAFEPLADQYGPILSVEQVAELAGYAVATMKKKLSERWFAARRGRAT